MNTGQLYCYPRLPNAGVGNRLLPWARSTVYARRFDLPRLAPGWWNIKVGPILRRESDWRWYVGQFRPTADEVVGVGRRWRLLTQAKQPEPADLTTPPAAGSGVIVFSGLGDYFGQLNDAHDLLRRELLAAVAPRWQGFGGFPPAPIALHIRRGDFKPVRSMDELKTTGNAQTPLGFFVETLRLVRRQAGGNTPAFVVSDGTREELRELLAEPNVRQVSTGSAIGDMLSLTRAGLLIGSGGSTFSLWGAFLAQCPAVFPVGQDPAWFRFKNVSERYVGVFDPWQPDLAVASSLVAALDRS